MEPFDPTKPNIARAEAVLRFTLEAWRTFAEQVKRS